MARIDTPSGAIIVGGKEPNTYDLDKMRATQTDMGPLDVASYQRLAP